jgi:hypothetical protein
LRFVTAPSAQKAPKAKGNIGASHPPTTETVEDPSAMCWKPSLMASIPVQQFEETDNAGPCIPNSIAM